MNPEIFVELFRDALWMVLIMVCAIIIPSLLIGLVVAIFQAATSINEQTLSFLPRLIVTLLALMLFVLVDGWNLILSTLAGSFAL